MAPKKPRAEAPPTGKNGPATAFRSHKICRIEVTGGFLDGLAEDLDPRLNCVIGGHGSGKTTVLELLRFAFRSRPDEDTPIDRLIQRNLGNGTLRVFVETKDGKRYSVARTASGDPEVRDQDNAPVNFDLAQGAVFDIDSFRHHEIERIAESPALQLELIDRFAQGALREVQDKVEGLLNQLRSNARELIDHERESASLERGTDELPALEARLRALPVVSGEAADAIARELEQKTLRHTETRAFERLLPALEQQRSLLGKASALLDGLEEAVPPQARGGPNAVVFDAVLKALRAARERLLRALGDGSTTARELVAALEAAKDDLARRHRDQELNYQAVVAKHGEQRALADERVSLERRVNELTDRKKRREVRGADRERLTEARTRLLAQLSTLRDERAAAREKVADALTAKLAPEIRVRIARGKDTTRFNELLNGALKGTGRPYQDLTKAVAKRYVPAEFVRVVLEGTPERAVEELATHLDVKPARAAMLVNGLRGNEEVYEIDVCAVDDVPLIELKVEDEFKSSEDLSAGQKCTTILPILLAESERPLLIDQPEDNLDNSYITTVVVEQLRQAKDVRQVVFATHNPNIPVLGEAGRVFVMKFEKKRGRVDDRGTVDEVRKHVEAILEGGEKAFQIRKTRYGY